MQLLESCMILSLEVFMYPCFEQVKYMNNQLPILIYQFTSKTSDKDVVFQKNLMDSSKSRVYNKKDCIDFLHWHESYEILYFTDEGPGIEINGDFFRPKAGDLLLIDMFDIHKNSIKLPDAHFVLLINPAFLPMQTEAILRFPMSSNAKWLRSNGLHESNRSQIAKRIEALIGLLKNDTNNDTGDSFFKIYGEFFLLLDAVSSYVGMIEPYAEGNFDEKIKSRKILKKVYNYVSRHYMREISLSEVARLVNFTEAYFCKFMKKSTDQTFLEFLNGYRCHMARIQLEASDLPITTIAMASGFTSLSYFSKVFRRYVGMSPRAYRNK